MRVDLSMNIELHHQIIVINFVPIGLDHVNKEGKRFFFHNRQRLEMPKKYFSIYLNM